MFKKFLLLASAVLVLPLSAQVFELKLENGKDNIASKSNHMNYLTFQIKAVGDVKQALVVASKDPASKKYQDTSFGLFTKTFDVKGKKSVIVEGSTFSTINILKAKGCRVVWAASGKEKIAPSFFALSWTKGKFSDFKVELPVPANAVKAQVMIGYDNPNYVQKDFFAVKSLKVSVK